MTITFGRPRNWRWVQFSTLSLIVAVALLIFLGPPAALIVALAGVLLSTTALITSVRHAEHYPGAGWSAVLLVLQMLTLAIAAVLHLLLLTPLSDELFPT